MIQLPKRYHPDFGNPRVKPIGGVKVGWEHPLARGLVHYNLLDALTNQNLAKNKELLTVGGTPTLDIAQGGKTIALDGVGDYLQSGENYNNSSKVSVAISIKLPSGASNAQFDRIFELGGFNTGDGGIGLEIASTTTSVNCVVWSTSTGITIGTSATTADKIHTVVITSDTSIPEHKCYFDGVLVGTNNSATRATTLTQFTLGGQNNSPSSNNTDCVVSNLGIWQDRILTLEDVKSLTNDPYSLLKPKQPMQYFIPAADLEVTSVPVVLTLSPTNAAVVTDTDLEVTATSVALSLSPTNAAVVTDTDLEVTSVPVSLTLSPTNATVVLGEDLEVISVPVDLTLSPTNPTVILGNDLEVTATSVALSLSPTNPAVATDIDLEVTSVPVALTLSPTNTTVVTDTDLEVTSVPVSLTLSPTNATIVGDLEVTSVPVTLSLSPTNAAVDTDIELTITATSVALALSTTNPSVITEHDLDVLASSVSLSLVVTNPDVSVTEDREVVATSVVLNLFSTNAIISHVGMEDIETAAIVQSNTKKNVLTSSTSSSTITSNTLKIAAS